MPDVSPPEIKDEHSEHLALELAVYEARTDPRQSIPHDLVRRQLLQDVDVARARIADLTAKARGAG